jgi:anti-sigma B factor antagonist
MAITTPAWIDVSQEVGTLILRVCGELDADSCLMIEPAVMAAIPTARKVILDLADLTFCDSIGLSMFLAAHHKAEAEQCTVIIRNVPQSIARLLEITGLDRTLNVTE